MKYTYHYNILNKVAGRIYEDRYADELIEGRWLSTYGLDDNFEEVIRHSSTLTFLSVAELKTHLLKSKNITLAQELELAEKKEETAMKRDTEIEEMQKKANVIYENLTNKLTFSIFGYVFMVCKK